MESKKVILPVEYITTKDGSGQFKAVPVEQNGTKVSIHLGSGDENSVFLDRPLEGHLMMQEFWTNENQKIYFEIDSNGHLLAILPEGYDAFVNEDGHLILVHGEAVPVYDGIGVMIIGQGSPQFTVS